MDMSENLPTAVLGRTGLSITRLGYGTAIKEIGEEEWQKVLTAVLDAGINFIDSANDYGVRAGRPAEEMIGKFISDRRDEYYLATKCGCPPGGAGPHIWNRDNAFRGLHESLRRMKTDYVDVMQYHNPTVEVAQADDLVTVLQDMKTEGKVRWLGISTTMPDLPTFLKWGVFDVFQIPYSVLQREHEEWIAKAGEAGAGIVIRGGVAQGEPGEGEARESRLQKWQRFEEAGLDELREEDESRTAFILRYTLSHPHAHSNIVGTTSTDHLAENLRSVSSGPLSPKVYAEAKRRMDGVGETPSEVSS